MNSYEIKRVPLDFNHPLKKIWPGYLPQNGKDKVAQWANFKSNNICKECKQTLKECDESFEHCMNHPDIEKVWRQEPPIGEGYQLWEFITEGSPVSPVFTSLDNLSEWCYNNVNHGLFKNKSRTDWDNMLSSNFIYREINEIIMI